MNKLSNDPSTDQLMKDHLNKCMSIIEFFEDLKKEEDIVKQLAVHNEDNTQDGRWVYDKEHGKMTWLTLEEIDNFGSLEQSKYSTDLTKESPNKIQRVHRIVQAMTQDEQHIKRPSQVDRTVSLRSRKPQFEIVPLESLAEEQQAREP